MKINALPAPTWNWLKMNYAEVDDFDNKEILKISPDIKNSADASAVKVTEENDAICINVSKTEGDVSNNKIILKYNIKSEAYADKIVLNACEGAELNLILVFENEGDALNSGLMNFAIEGNVEEKASIKLTQVFLGNVKALVNNAKLIVNDKAKVEVIQIFLADGKTYSELNVDLCGKHADVDVKNAYIVKENSVLDINYLANHIGRKTLSNMEITGVLKDKAKKIFRGTIDLRKGGKGAEGAEHEDVILIDEGVINQTIPLILCTEEDVSGIHGATIGRIDEDLVFYLKSRGLSEEYIYDMISNSRIENVAGFIGDEEIVTQIKKKMYGESFSEEI